MKLNWRCALAKEASQEDCATHPGTIDDLPTAVLSKQQPISLSAWRIADLSVLGLWSLVAAFTLLHHEKWADEAQAWLLARDLDLSTLWFRELRYEGTPGLWHSLLWLAQRLFHVPYSGLGAIGLLCAAGGIAVMLLRAPFPRPVRWLLAFSYFMVYQYAVIARPYVLLPLLAFAAALLFKDANHPERITIVLALLANLSAHGALLAACIGLAYLWQGARSWAAFDERVRGRYVLSVGAMLLVFLFLFAVLQPPPDVEAMHTVRDRTLSAIASRAWQGINGAFFDFAPLTLGLLVLIAVWSFLRRGASALLVPIVILVLGILYGYYGLAHHQGTIFIAAITGLWIAWPTAQETKTFSAWGRWTHQALVVGLVCLLAYQVWNAVAVIRNEYRYPYSGAEDAAKYLKSVGADREPLIGYGDYMAGVQAYFDRNIQINKPTTYFHHGEPLDRGSVSGAEIQSYAAAYVVFTCWSQCESEFQTGFDPFMHTYGYSLVHSSDGYLLSKRGWDMRQVYFIYHRN
jgi:hypothetical protein